jgi:hypothetical protein
MNLSRNYKIIEPLLLKQFDFRSKEKRMFDNKSCYRSRLVIMMMNLKRQNLRFKLKTILNLSISYNELLKSFLMAQIMINLFKFQNKIIAP